MLNLTDIPPHTLNYRHRLSTRQINLLFGTRVLDETLEEKAAMLARTGEFIRVTSLLREEGIDFIALKGPLLSYRLYGDATVRKYGDLDLMVAAGEVDRACRCLLKAGYSEYMTAWPATGRGRRKALRYWHHILFRNPDGDEVIELHWRLLNRQWLNFRESDDFVRENLMKIDFQGNSFNVLKPEAELLYLVIHGAAHRWGMLKWLADIARYIETVPFDREIFCRLVNSFGCGRLVSLCNSMLSVWFPGCSSPLPDSSLPASSLPPGASLLPGAALPSRYMERCAMRAIENPVNIGPESWSEIFRRLPYTLLAYPGVRYKLKLAASVAGNSLFSGRLGGIIK